MRKMLLNNFVQACLLCATIRAAHPPTIKCPSVRALYTADKGLTTTRVTWPPPKVSDPDGGKLSLSLRTPKGSGSVFGRGVHTVVYQVVDSGGLKDSCMFTFTIRVIDCRLPQPFQHGVRQCSGINYGSRCDFSCDPGYRLVGSNSIECQGDSTWSHPSPTCLTEECHSLSLPRNGKNYTCTNGWKAGSICLLECDESRGYAPARGQSTVCSLQQTWSNLIVECVDIKKPQILNCPAHALVKLKDPTTNLTSVEWEKPITVSDNSGEHIEVKPVSDKVNYKLTSKGGMFPEGITLVKLTAQDSARNTATMCAFNVIVKAIDCGPPILDDPNLSVSGCDGFREGSVCHLKCYQALKLQGRSSIQCKRNSNSPATAKGFWDYGQNDTPPTQKTHCEVPNCPVLPAPKFGAMTCSKWDLGATCMMSCQDGYDIPKNMVLPPMIYHCDQSTNKWTMDNVPDCVWQEFGENNRMKSNYYFPRNCTSAQQEIKTNFLTVLGSYNICRPAKYCTVENVNVRCGDDTEPDWSR